MTYKLLIKRQAQKVLQSLFGLIEIELPRKLCN